MTPSAHSEPVTFTCDPDAVGWITFDAPGARANVFNAPTQRALAAALDEAERSAARALIIVGAKEKIFIAGADLRWLQQLPNAAAAEAFSREGQRLFERVATFRGPVIAAIHGACAGGGFELALASHWRIATDAVVTRIGLPETSIGTIPGWGGCVRLPRLVGVQPALDHILKAQLVEPGEALKRRFVDELVPVGALKERAKAAALRLLAAGRPGRPGPAAPPAGFLAQTRAAVEAKRHQPALLAAVNAIEQGHRLADHEAYAVEAREFGCVTAADECKNLIHGFFLREAVAKRTLDGWFDETKAAAPAPLRRIGVVGAGVMGSGIAHWLATRGYEVILRDVQREFVERARAVIQALLDDGVRRGKTTADDARAVFGRIQTTTSWEGFADCDLVIEAIVEDAAAKRQLFSELAAIVRPDALLASNSSALPIEDTAGHVPQPGRTLGIHFFNPVSRMALVELIIGRDTTADAASRALSLVRGVGKLPVICRSSPGFLVTRVLFFYLNAAVRLWEQGVEAGRIDGGLTEFGWPMGPLRLIDEVGIDVTAFIFGEMAQAFPERFVATGACRTLARAGLNGRKNGASRGFYRYGDAGRAESNEAEARAITAAAPDATRPPVAAGTALDGPQIVDALMRVMVEEARRCVDEGVVRSPDDADFALISGAGFPAFRGGLLRWADAHLRRTE